MSSFSWKPHSFFLWSVSLETGRKCLIAFSDFASKNETGCGFMNETGLNYETSFFSKNMPKTRFFTHLERELVSEEEMLKMS